MERGLGGIRPFDTYAIVNSRLIFKGRTNDSAESDSDDQMALKSHVSMQTL